MTLEVVKLERRRRRVESVRSAETQRVGKSGSMGDGFVIQPAETRRIRTDLLAPPGPGECVMFRDGLSIEHLPLFFVVMVSMRQ